MSTEPPVIVFDGVCLLCSRWVGFVLRHDRTARIRFAAMQSASGRALLARHGLDADDPLSFLYVADGRSWQDSDAILRVLTGFGGAWRLAGAARVIPRALRDAGYRLIARNRYRWFGRRDVCLVPDAAVAARFLD
ncbi:thiol-disulfide oxidoreductase DCC family protein [Tahibacter soli]|uniref:Thiol-disulfide oxidoreductase DCC family protein n=1 Tax=Tahibacter soli TaxID=2983605 RepID=A0A9X4BKK3_9GAMM|nr:thiol-disulfide oxidoreductase DCC family protein [Tahibacter soli]MDC8015808.1 thiol-disulfide oxidoreductase DCC family protein [Tahibacter soli]